MDYTKNQELAIYRAKIAISQKPQKLLARQIGISASLLSQYLNGTLSMPNKIKRRLISKLGLKTVIEKIENSKKE